jgi:ATP-dependent DNA helicase RecQ
MEAESDDVSFAIEEFDGDFEEEEIRLFRIKFTNEIAN